jgi:hypothetical protein
MTSNDMTEFAERYVALWNDLDAPARRSSAQRLYASDARIATASSERDGLDEVIAHIDKVVGCATKRSTRSASIPRDAEIAAQVTQQR